MNTPEYDPRTCITAGELRAGGATIRDEVPDCAWVPRWAIRWEPKASLADAPGTIAVDLRAILSEPFRWIEITITGDAIAHLLPS